MFLPLLLALLFSDASSKVLEYTDQNFDSEIVKHSITLVKFYAPWCGHCKALAPKFEAAAMELAQRDPPIHLIKVDCTTETKICQRLGINGYPTLKLYKNGIPSDFNGERETRSIVNALKALSGPASREVLNMESLDKFRESNRVLIFGIFVKDSSDHSLFTKVAEALREDFDFAHTHNLEIAKLLNQKEGILMLHPKRMWNKFEPKILNFDGAREEALIQAWIKKNCNGLAGHRHVDSIKWHSNRPLVVAYYDVDYEKDPKGTNYIRNRIMMVGKKFVDAGKKIYFAVSNVVEMSHEMSEYGISDPVPKKVYVAARDESNRKYVMKDAFSATAFEKFVDDFLAKKLQPYLKSEDVPTSNKEPVKVVVAKTFDDIVNDPTKDVLIEFYAPWCGHCKSLAPKYDQLAKDLAGEDDVVIAKMDATANDVPEGYEVRGFPTIYFARKNNKTPKPYEGAREVVDFIKFLAKESTDGLKTFDKNGKKIKKAEL